MNNKYKKKDFMRRKIKHVHFVGIGGIGMSGIAEVLLNLGYSVTGSDISTTDITNRLISLGAIIFQGHSSSNVSHADVVVTSTAVHKNNPEVLEAHTRHIPVIPRAEMLAELLKMKFSIAVSGCHGKTTTTSMIATILFHGNLDPTMVVGGKIASIGSNARLGDGEIIVAEADESDGSFLRLNPTIAVVTNIDREHLDYYNNIEEIKNSFLQFVNNVPFYGTSILCFDNEHVKDILPKIARKTITYGLSGLSDYRASDISFDGFESKYILFHKNKRLGDISLRVPGLFNVYNSMASIAAARELNIDFPVIQEGIKTFGGVHRRLEVKGNVNGITIVDDYGHHPTEIKATLAAARHVWKNNRIIAVFQPHRYTRTQKLFEEFLDSFNDADELILTDIYAASEKKIDGVHSQILCEGITNNGYKNANYIENFDEIVAFLYDSTTPGDVIITLGAGNVWEIGEGFLNQESQKIRCKA